MSVLCVLYLPDFYFGDDAVVVAMDTAGLDVLAAALEQARTHGDSRFAHHGHTHRILAQAGAADLELHDAHVHWRLDHIALAGMIDMLAALKDSNSGHHYADIATPASTLVLSLNEYLDAPFLLSERE